MERDSRGVFLRLLRKNIGRNPPISQLPGVIPSFTQRTWFSTSITYDARWDGYIILAVCAQDQGLNARSCHHDCDLSLSQDWRGTPNWNLASCVKKIKCTSWVNKNKGESRVAQTRSTSRKTVFKSWPFNINGHILAHISWKSIWFIILTSNNRRINIYNV